VDSFSIPAILAIGVEKSPPLHFVQNDIDPSAGQSPPIRQFLEHLQRYFIKQPVDVYTINLVSQLQNI
jgi:hypothetical protein